MDPDTSFAKKDILLGILVVSISLGIGFAIAKPFFNIVIVPSFIVAALSTIIWVILDYRAERKRK